MCILAQFWAKNMSKLGHFGGYFGVYELNQQNKARIEFSTSESIILKYNRIVKNTKLLTN